MAALIPSFFQTMFFTILLLQSFIPTSADIGLVDGIYCGLKTCYEVLDVDRDTDKKTIRKKYRNLSLKYHPDKFLEQKNNGELSEAEYEQIEHNYSIINTAYDTLKDDVKKADYNHYLDHPEDRYYNYFNYYKNKLGANVTVDVKLVIVGFLSAWSLFQWVGWQNSYNMVIEYALQDNKYKIMAKRLAIEQGLLDSNGKIPKKEQRTTYKTPIQCKNRIEEIYRQIIEQNVDIKGGYGKPHWTDVAIVQAVFLPKYIYLYFYKKINWWYRRNILKAELNEDEKWILIQKNLKLGSQVEFEYLKDKKGDLLYANECWVPEKCEAFQEKLKEEERLKNLDSGRAKQYKRWLKKNGGENRMTFNENDDGGWED